MRPNTRALLTCLAIVLPLTGVWALSSSAAEPDATGKLYLLLATCPGCTTVTPTAAAPSPTPVASSVADEVIRLVNIERVKVGCPEVVADPQLMAATQAWSEYMAATSDYRHATASWYAPYGFPSGVLENIGSASTPGLIVDAWMASTPHRRNLLWCYPTDDPSYDPNRIYKAGVGYAEPYWTWGLVDQLP